MDPAEKKQVNLGTRLAELTDTIEKDMAMPGQMVRRRHNFRVTAIGDRVFNLTTLLLALVTLALLFGLTAVLVVQSMPSIKQFGFGFLVELLAAIPSVVYGLWAVFVLGPWLRDYIEPPLGKTLGFLPLFQGPRMSVGMMTAAVVLAIMVLPYITAVCTDVFRVVPQTQREAALALGATKWEMVRIAVLPFGLSGVIGAIILGLGRALGETIAVAMVIGNRPEISASLFKPSSTLASVIANEFVEATSVLNLAALIELGLVLLALGLVLNVVARVLVAGVTQRRFSGAR